jgi:spore maturation protein CgeB
MHQKLLESFATVNIHGEAAGEEAVNMRLFEATGVGTCLLTDWKPSLIELFDEDEVVSFRSADEFVERVRWLEDNPGQRDAIAQAGNRRTLRDHTFGNRVGDLLEVVNEVLRHKSARCPIARVHG